MSNILDIITSQKLTYEQKLISLAHAAEDTQNVLDIPELTQYYFDNMAIDDLFEGNAPYRPRYIMPDYSVFVKNGSEFLGLDAPQDLDELLNSLMIVYRHVPSITSFPVYLGDLDKLIDPFLDGLDDEVIKKKLRLFLNYLDRTVTDSFCHANLGPEETRAGRLILEVEKELQNAVPNLTLKYDKDLTSDAFAEQGLHTSLFVANPAFANHKLLKDTYGDVDYGISSCYNILPTPGGAYTLSRLVLPKMALLANDSEDFFNRILPECLEAMGNYMNERVRFLVEESGFFESSFLVKEGLINKDNFVGMFGLVGLADGANTLMVKDGKEGRYGNSAEADDLAERIMEAISDFAQNFEAVHSPLTNNRFLLHAQVGMDYDEGVTEMNLRIFQTIFATVHVSTNFYQQDVVISLQWKVQHVKILRQC